MKKSYIITAVVVLLVVLVLVGVFLRDDIARLVGGDAGTTAPMAVDLDEESYVSMVKGSVDNAEPMMKTDIDNLYYTMSREGEVSFFRVEGTQIQQVAATGSYEVTVNCTEENIPATVYYYQTGDGQIAGYGLFTTEMSDADVQIYEYAFFRLMNLPASYAEDGAYMLMVDTTKEDFYSNDKVYEENMIFYTDSGDTEYLLSNNNRAFDTTGAYRADYAMLTEDAVKKCGERFLFFSSRQYHLYTSSNQMDIYMADGSGNNEDNDRYIQDVVDFYFSFDESGRVVCLQRNGETGFNVIAFSDGETTVLKEFEGDYSENYLRSGDWLLNKNTLEVYHIMTGESHTLSLSGTSGFVPDLFETDGSHIFMRGVSANAAAIVLGSMDGACGCYHNEIFSRVFAPAVLTDGSVMVSVAADDAGSSYSIKIFGVPETDAA